MCRFAMLTVLAVIAAILSTLVFVGPAAAKKPAPPDPDPIDGGVIYHFWLGDASSLLPDGTGGSAVTSELPANSPPSEYTHGGKRWFLTIGRIEGETYPDGRYRFEVFAESESGTRVQITNAPNVQPTYASQGVPGLQEFDQSRVSLVWALGDRRISYVAREWSGTTVVRGGIFYADLPADFTRMTPVVPTCVPVPLIEHVTYGPHVRIYNQGVAWSPDGSEVAYSTDGGLYRASAATGAALLLTAATQRIQRVRWSPSEARILFDDSDGILTIKTDGTSRTLIVAPDRKGWPDQPEYSPAGTHIVFRYRTSHPDPKKITRNLKVATAAGGAVTTILEDSGIDPHWVSE